MVVEPGLLNHPKFRGLARLLGGGERGEGRALKVLLRLWFHCQEKQRGETWPKADPEYLKAVCDWNGEAQKLVEALQFPMGPCRGGFIRISAETGVNVLGWEEMNLQLVLNWKRNKSGLAKNPNKKPPNGTPRGVHGVPLGEAAGPPAGPPVGGPDKRREEKRGVPPFPPGSGGGGAEEKNGATHGPPESEENGAASPEEILAEIPDAAEMFEYFQATGQPVTLEVCRKYANWCDRKEQWVIRNGMGRPIVRRWKLEVLSWQNDDRRGYGAAKKEEDAAEEIENIRAELQWQKNPEKMQALARRKRVLEGKS
jgi:hypothetical protein